MGPHATGETIDGISLWSRGYTRPLVLHRDYRLAYISSAVAAEAALRFGS